MAHFRLTANVVKVLRAFLDEPGGECLDTDLVEDHYGYQLMAATGLPSGTLYPIVARMEAAGWVQAREEDVDPAVVRRKPRRYYRLTALGRVEARIAVDRQDRAVGR